MLPQQLRDEGLVGSRLSRHAQSCFEVVDLAPDPGAIQLAPQLRFDEGLDRLLKRGRAMAIPNSAKLRRSQGPSLLRQGRHDRGCVGDVLIDRAHTQTRLARHTVGRDDGHQPDQARPSGQLTHTMFMRVHTMPA